MILPLSQACGLPAPLSGEPCVRYLAFPEKGRGTDIGGGGVIHLKLFETLRGIRWCDSTPQASLRLASSPFRRAMRRYLASSERRGEPPSAVEVVIHLKLLGTLRGIRWCDSTPQTKPTACQLPFQESHASVSCLP